MKKYISFLLLSLVLVLTTLVSTFASAATISISKTSVPTKTNTWWYIGDGEGWTVTKYANQSCNLSTTETGYSIKVGIQTANNQSRYPIFLNSSYYTMTNIIRSADMNYATGSYKPYVYNGSSVSMTIKDGGYFVLK